MTRLIACGAAIAALAIALPLSSVNAADGHHKRHGGGHAMHAANKGGHHGARHHRRDEKQALIRLQQGLERFDQNGDGSISQEEVDQVRTDRLKAFDKDGNGALSLEEYEALWLDAMRKRMVRSFQKHDRDGDGSVTVEEFTETTKYMVLRRDRNEDGVLNKDDLKHARKQRKGDREARRMRHRNAERMQRRENKPKNSE